MMSPMETIVFLAGEAKSAKYEKVSNYFFFKTHKKSYFTTIEDLLKKGKIKEVYYTTPQNIPRDNNGNASLTTQLNSSDKEANAELRNPIDFRTSVYISFDHNFNVEQNIKMGMYDNTVLTIDPILQQFKPVDVKSFQDALNPQSIVQDVLSGRRS